MHVICKSIPIIAIFVLQINNNESFIVKSPIKQVALVRALRNTVTEAIAFNVFDQSSLYKELSCNCNNYNQIALYTSGFVIFSYIALKNNYVDNKIKDISFYKKSKRYFRMLLFTILFFLNKDVYNVY